jgi:HK97 family phage prohead protease
MADGSTRKHFDDGKQLRYAKLERFQSADVETYQASLSSELPVERWFGVEVLRHDDKAVDMARAARGLPLLFNHNTNEPIGRVQNIRIERGRMVGEFQFSPNSEQAKRIKADVDGGFLGDVSIAYSIDKYETTTDDRDMDTVTVTRWTPLEASIVTVPADHTVGVGRSRHSGGVAKPQENTMADDNTPVQGQEGGAPSVDVAKVRSSVQAASVKGAKAAVAGERERIRGIRDLFTLTRFKGESFDALRDQCIDDGLSVDGARQALLELIEAEAPPQTATVRSQPDDVNGDRPAVRQAGGFQRAPLVQAGASASEKVAEGIQRAIELRAGLLKPEEAAKERASQFRGLTLIELGREWAQANNLRVAGLDKMGLAGFLFTQGRRDVAGLGGVDFTGIIANVASKSLFAGWDEAPTTWQTWCRTGSLPDFKRANRTGLSGVDLLTEIGENGEITYGKATDRTEYIQLKTYAKAFKLTRQVIVNDDLGAFSAMPRKMGQAAARTLNKTVYDLLTTASGVGPTLNQTGRALFNTTDANYDASSGAIAVSTLDTARSKMRRQKDPNNSQPLNITPKYLLVPAALEYTAQSVIKSVVDPLGTASATGGATTPNPFFNALEVVCEPTLDDASNGATAWYVIGDQNMFDTFEVAFLDGNQTPVMEQQDDWSVDGTSFKVRHDWGVSALDFRAMYRKRGA